MSSFIFVGVAWPYANGPLHLGHIAGAYLPADIFARYHRLAGNHVLMVSGSDQHGTPITVRAEQEGITAEAVAERFHESFLESWNRLGISWDLFTRTGTANHTRVVQDLFLKLHKAGYIYIESMKMPYCPKDQRHLPDRYVLGNCPLCGASGARGDQCDACGRTLNALDLVDPQCRFCGTRPEVVDTEHFFFRWSAFNDRLREWTADKSWWKPNVANFTRRYLEEGLRDSAITRDIEWGIPVPIAGYEQKRIYVWFEAVIGYLSASMEWAEQQGDPEKWRSWWEGDSRSWYFIGKDNIPFHTIRWPAMLMGCGDPLNLPYDVPSNEYLTLEGEKISTSKNWAVWVPDYLERFDPDPLRFFLSASMPEASDTDFSWRDFVRRNNDELVAAYGNLVHRCLTFAARHFEGQVPPADGRTEVDLALIERMRAGLAHVGELIERCAFREAVREAMRCCQEGNQYLDAQAPWRAVKTDRPRGGAIVNTMLNFINGLKVMFSPFLPNSSRQLHQLLGNPYPESEERWALRELSPGHALAPAPAPLFKKLEDEVAEVELARLRQESEGPQQETVHG